MDRRDSAGGAGESLGEAPGAPQSGESMRRGALDTQYGTRSGLKTAGRASSGGSGASGAKDPPAPPSDAGGADDATDGDRDTMTGPRPGRGA
jgi:hypothetical protein